MSRNKGLGFEKKALVSLMQIEGKLWEIRVAKQRIFYVVIQGPILLLLHAYQKQSQKAPKREIEVARKRMKQVLAAYGGGKQG